MSLQFVLGGAKSGKSFFIYDMLIRERSKDPDKNYILIVPEQSNLNVQRELVQVHPKHSVLGIDVLSFKRLAYRIFEDSGEKIPVIIDETGKSMLLKKILIEKDDELTIFKGACRKSGFIDKLKKELSELTQYEINELSLLRASDSFKDKPQISAKLHDLYIISSAFKAALDNNYITSEDLIPKLIPLVAESEYLKNSVLVLDGFHDLTPVQLSLMGELLLRCKKVYVVLDMKRDMFKASANQNSLFTITRQIYDSLTIFSEKTGVRVLDSIWIEPEISNYSSEELAFLESSYEQSVGVFDKKTQDIRLIEAGDPQKEIFAVCSQIIRCVREKNMHYSDIAVITSDLNTYGDILERSFNQSGIPFFCDKRHSLRENTGVGALLAAIDVMAESFSFQAVFRYLKCGYIEDIEFSDICENYCMAFGIKGIKRFKGEWNRKLSGMTDEDLLELNKKKNELLAPLLKLNKSFKENRLVSDRIRAVRSFMEESCFPDRMSRIKEELEYRGELDRAQEYDQIANQCKLLFDQIDEMIGSEKLSVKELSEIIEAGFNEASTGVVPPTVDGIVIADMRRSRLSDVKAIFVIGVNDGVFPGTVGDTGILSSLDREELRAADIRLSLSAKKESFFDKFHIYRIFTKPSHRLYLSWSKQSLDGKTVRPSYVINQIRRIFPLAASIDSTYEIYNIRQGLEILAGGESDEAFALKRFYQERPEYADIVKLIDAASNRQHVPERITGKMANMLFAASDSTSVTHIEKYASCRWAHFLKYGLCLSERQEYKLRSFDMGNLFHSALDDIFKIIHEEDIDLHSISEDRVSALVNGAVEKALEGFKNGKSGSDIFDSSERFNHIQKKMLEILNLNLKALIFQLNAGSYKNRYTEMAFGMKGSNEFPPVKLDEGPLSLLGKIDRLDIADEAQVSLARVIDYKTGDVKFDITKFYYGLSLQLILYLDAVMKIGTAEEVGGAFYYHIDDPYVDISEEEAEKGDISSLIFEKKLYSLKMRGLVNGAETSIRAFESGLGGDDYKTSKILNGLALTKDSYKKGAPVLSDKSFKKLMMLAEKKAAELERDMLSGDVDTDPYVYGSQKPCSYCEFKQACGFCTDFPGYAFRRLKKQSMPEVLGNSQEDDSGSRVD